MRKTALADHDATKRGRAIPVAQRLGDLCRNCRPQRSLPANRPVLGCGARCRNRTSGTFSKALGASVAPEQIIAGSSPKITPANCRQYEH